MAVDGSEPALHAARLAHEIARTVISEKSTDVSFDSVPKYLGEPLRQKTISAHFQVTGQIAQSALAKAGNIPGLLQTSIVQYQ
jgi:hypothetical protein